MNKSLREENTTVNTKRKRIYVDMHVLQSVPPSCINRDDTGSPKTAVYGGSQRARISSQAWKKAMRDMFKEHFPVEKLSVRSKKVAKLIAENIQTQNPEISDDDAMELTRKVLALIDIKLKDDQTEALFFMSYAQAKALAEMAVERSEDLLKKKQPSDLKKLAKSILQSQPGIDIALFGRMLASDPTLNTDACSQVAHAISTHAVHNEFDYFTATDDLPDEEHAGAAHIGITEYNSSLLYRYATIAVHELYESQRDDTVDAVIGFLDSFVRSMPTGRQNSFANRTLPEALLVTIRVDQPLNLVGAFESPVSSEGKGYYGASAQKLVEHTERLYANFAGEPLYSYVVGVELAKLGECLNFQQLKESLAEDLSREIG